MTGIDALIERLKAGKTGRAIDRLVFLALGFRLDPTPNDKYFVAPNDDGTAKSLVCGDRLNISTSLDACIALMERVLPGWAWFVQKIDVPAHRSSADIWIPAQRTQGLSRERYWTEAHTPVAALLIAILTAVKAEKEQT